MDLLLRRGVRQFPHYLTSGFSDPDVNGVYVGMPPQLFDLDADPAEARDLGQEPGYAGLVRDCEVSLRRICDPEVVDRAARTKQRSRIEALGGREAMMARGSFGYSPAPGTQPVYT